MDFEKYLETINRQIKDIESLVNEFSNFARMPRPVFEQINIVDVINRSIDFIKMSSKNTINFHTNHKRLIIKGDAEQLNRVFSRDHASMRFRKEKDEGNLLHSSSG